MVLETTPKLVRRDLTSAQLRSMLFQRVIPAKEMIGGVKYHPTHKRYAGVLPYKLWSIQGCAAGQGMVFDLSVLNRLYNFVQVKSVWRVLPAEMTWFNSRVWFSIFVSSNLRTSVWLDDTWSMVFATISLARFLSTKREIAFFTSFSCCCMPSRTRPPAWLINDKL